MLVDYTEIEKNNNSLVVGQYFRFEDNIKEYSKEEFNCLIDNYKKSIIDNIEKGKSLEEEIIKGLDELKYE